MKRLIIFGPLVAASLATPALSAGINVVQTRRANVYGTVQAGPQVQPTTLSQTGRANVAGIVQAGGGAKSASVTQTGPSNQAFVGQFNGPGRSITRPRLP
ncbi:curlin repeat-containing protein [Methylobacterium sp. A54F]